MRDHLRVLAILNIAMGALTALIGVVVFFVTGALAGYIASAANLNQQDTATAVPIIAGIGLAIAIFFWVLALPSVLGGWGLLNLKPWSWLLMVIVSILQLFHVPIGTALGVYGLWVLFSDDAQRLLGRRRPEFGFAGPGVETGPPASSYPSQQPPRPV